MDLVILAAGMGSRYGGLKQIEPVGPSGETMLDYAVHDARRAGFTRAVFVIRKDFAELFRNQVAAKYAGKLEVELVFQEMGAAPREKPWGTGHAVLAARSAVAAPFAVINADDFYGWDSFRRLGEFLRREAQARRSPPRYAMAGFRLAQTLSEHGAVSRGVAQVRQGLLTTVEEKTGILAEAVGPGHAYSGEEVVSMNCWGFLPAVFEPLAAAFAEFVRTRGADPRAEFYLPAAIAGMIARGEAEVEVLPTDARWFGVTYREDRPAVQQAIEARVAAGEYPRKLF